MKYISIALLTSLALAGCSKPQNDIKNEELTQSIEKMSLNDDAPAQAVSSPLIIARNEITTPLTKTGENFQELIKDEGYFSFYPPYKTISGLQMFAENDNTAENCLNCVNFQTVLNDLRSVLALKNNQVLVIGHTGQQFPASTFALGDDYSLRAAHDTAINYIRSTMQVIPPQKDQFESTEQYQQRIQILQNELDAKNANLNYDLKLLEVSLNATSGQSLFMPSSYTPNDRPSGPIDNFVYYDADSKQLHFEDMNFSSDLIVNFTAPSTPELAKNIITAAGQKYVGYIFNFNHNKLELDSLVIYQAINTQTGIANEPIAILEPSTISFQRKHFNGIENARLKKFDVAFKKPIHFDFTLDNYTPIEHVFKKIGE
ncbi:hypothetical protein [Acinetobacter radioresistens]|uniref:hypothetical protein n=1 Tax=Acinetobacter radioresistens TaxID=40216 RepID=UPI002006CBD4|nr:hypothetical protein [Acinetobacter radioresistens]MCK4101526.1 hypothetical protein [Acinetobacter radioresistens]